jgi:hypothetical protein
MKAINKSLPVSQKPFGQRMLSIERRASKPHSVSRATQHRMTLSFADLAGSNTGPWLRLQTLHNRETRAYAF